MYGIFTNIYSTNEPIQNGTIQIPCYDCDTLMHPIIIDCNCIIMPTGIMIDFVMMIMFVLMIIICRWSCSLFPVSLVDIKAPHH